VNACSALAEAQAKLFGYVVFRDGHEIAIGHLYVDHVAAKAAAMQIAQPDGAQGRAAAAGGRSW
jgi:hypothetical protein